MPKSETHSPPTSVRLLPQLITLTVVVGLAVLAVYAVAGQTMLEKTLTALVMPCGIAWLLLTAVVYVAARSKTSGLTMIGLLAWLAFTLGGNAVVSNWLIGQLEAPWAEVDSVTGEAVDVAVVLGGGTGSKLDGRSQVTADGDRTVTAARMYHAERVKTIVCTGTQLHFASEEDVHFREEAKRILIGLGVPESDIAEIKGINTSEEMQNLREWVTERYPNANADSPKIAIVTSAYHLSRAMRLAKANGVDATGIPANFISGPATPSPHWVVPSADSLVHSSAAIKEYLAALIGR